MEQKLTKRHVLVVFTGMLISFAPAAIVFNVWGIFVVPVTGELQVATNQFTFYVAIIFLAAAFMAPVMGGLLEKFDIRLVGTVSVGVCAFGVLLGSFYAEVWQFYLSGLMEGLGIIALNFLLIPTLINRWFTANNGLLLGICMSMTGVGGATWNFVGGLIIGSMGWRAAYLILGIVAATAMLATVFCIRSYPRDVGLQPYGRTASADAAGAEALRRGVPQKAAFGSAAFFLLLIAAAIFNLSCQAGQYFPSYVYDLDAQGVLNTGTMGVVMAASTASACLQASAAICKVTMGFVADKSLSLSVIICCGGGFAGLAMLWLLGPSSVVAIYVGAALYGLIFAAIDVLAPTIGRYMFGPREYTRIYSRVTIAVNIAGALGVTLLATLSDFGWAVTFGSTLALIALSLVLALAAIRASRRLEFTIE
ncbi:MAG: MFS transporter [Coriobacteriia bacterium]|nr:MFS transporter [Coriobacteriia bacterium]